MKTLLKVSAAVFVLSFIGLGLAKISLAQDFVATSNPAHLNVINTVVGGSATSADFSVTVTGASANPGTFAGSESGTDVELTALTDYEVGVDAPADYVTTFSDHCSGTSINEFHPLTCTITNTYVAPVINPAHLTVIKHVVGGTAVASDFEITVTGGSATPATFHGSETGTDVTLTPESTYSVTEGIHDGYTATYSEGCNGTSINEFHPSTCTITNTFNTPSTPGVNPAHITVTKHVVGGTAVASDFVINVTGASATPSTFNGSETGTDVAINPNTVYSITEGAHDGYTATYSEGCNGTSINEFHPSTCTITNTFNNSHSGGSPTSTIVATKIICNAETDLPNWSGADMTITSTTATDYVAAHPNCHLAPDWKFQVRYWGASDQTGNLIPNATDPGGTFVGETGAPWTTISGVTDANGVISTTFNSNDVWHFFVREVLKDGYIPFSAGPDNLPGSDVSAEMYCHNDVQNYDNLEHVDGPFVGGETFHCVAFNVAKAPTTTDVCPNIEGNQSVVPSGKHLDNEGNCIDDETTTTRHHSSGGGVSGGRAIPTGEVLGAEAPVPQVLAAEVGLPRTDGGNIPMSLYTLTLSGLLTLFSLTYLSRKTTSAKNI